MCQSRPRNVNNVVSKAQCSLRAAENEICERSPSPPPYQDKNEGLYVKRAAARAASEKIRRMVPEFLNDSNSWKPKKPKQKKQNILSQKLARAISSQELAEPIIHETYQELEKPRYDLYPVKLIEPVEDDSIRDPFELITTLNFNCQNQKLIEPRPIQCDPNPISINVVPLECLIQSVPSDINPCAAAEVRNNISLPPSAVHHEKKSKKTSCRKKRTVPKEKIRKLSKKSTEKHSDPKEKIRKVSKKSTEKHSDPKEKIRKVTKKFVPKHSLQINQLRCVVNQHIKTEPFKTEIKEEPEDSPYFLDMFENSNDAYFQNLDMDVKKEEVMGFDDIHVLSHLFKEEPVQSTSGYACSSNGANNIPVEIKQEIEDVDDVIPTPPNDAADGDKHLSEFLRMYLGDEFW